MNLLFKLLPFIVLCYGLFDFYEAYSLNQKKQTELRATLDQVKSENKKIKEDIKQIQSIEEGSVDTLQKKVNDAKDNLDEVTKMIPPIDDKAVILNELSSVAKNLNIKNISFKPKYGNPSEEGLYLINGIEFKGKGTFLQFMLFFERIKKLKRIFNISTLKIENKSFKKTGKHVLVDFKAVIETFHYLDKKDEKND